MEVLIVGRNLRLFDVSEYISAGSKKVTISNGVIEDGGKFRPNEMPCGGLTYLFNTIYEYNDANTDLVYCIDRPPHIKRALHERTFPNMQGYKGNRAKKDDSIVIQREMAEDILQRLGLNVLAVDDLEADDVIASVVQYYKDDYEHVYIHGMDSDLFYLVCDNVEVVPLTNGYVWNGKMHVHGKHINMSNWESQVCRDYIVPYDTLTIHKLCMGEMGDGIPAIDSAKANLIVKHIPESIYAKCGDNKLLKNWISDAVSGDPRVLATLDLITPIITDYNKVPIYEEEFDKNLCDEFAYCLSNKYVSKLKIGTLNAETVLSGYIDSYNRR
jgi:hypothetical protein